MELLGFMQNKMVWREVGSRWEIVNLFTDKPEAFMNESSGLPLGTNPWFFTDGSGCSDPGKEWRSLNLHLKVEQHQCKLCHGMFAKGGILEEHIALSHLGFKTEKEWRKARYVYQILDRSLKVFPRGEFSNHRLLRNLLFL